MRILVVPKWYPWPERPVFGIFCQEHARALMLRHDVVVLASEAVPEGIPLGFTLEDGTEDGLRTLRLRYRRPRDMRPAAMGFQTMGMLVALARLRREGWRPDVIHAHVYSAGLPAVILGRRAGAPVVVSEHYTGFQRGLITGSDHLTALLAFRHADLVAPVSEELSSYIRGLAPAARVEVVDNVVDTDAFHPPPEPRPAPPPARLLTVAALAAKKGHGMLLQAVAALSRERELTLDLVGDGELRGELERQARELGLGGRVRFHGELPKDRVAELMRAAHLFVLPSLYENLPCVLIEALASGLPAVGTAVGGVPGLLQGGAGWVCPPGDLEALTRTVAAALDAAPEVDGASLATHARERFGYEALADRWSALYATLPRSAGTTRVATASRTASGR